MPDSILSQEEYLERARQAQLQAEAASRQSVPPPPPQAPITSPEQYLQMAKQAEQSRQTGQQPVNPIPIQPSPQQIIQGELSSQKINPVGSITQVKVDIQKTPSTVNTPQQSLQPISIGTVKSSDYSGLTSKTDDNGKLRYYLNGQEITLADIERITSEASAAGLGNVLEPGMRIPLNQYQIDKMIEDYALEHNLIDKSSPDYEKSLQQFKDTLTLASTHPNDPSLKELSTLMLTSILDFSFLD